MKSNKIKVVIAINDFMFGGAQKLIVDILRKYDSEKFEFVLFTFFDFFNKKNFYDIIPRDTRVYRLNFKRTLDFVGWYRYLKAIVKEKPDVVLSNLFFSNTITRFFKLFFRYKSIIVEHNTYVGKKKIDILIDRILSYVTYRIVGVSKEVCDFTSSQESIDKSKFLTIYNGICVEDIKKYSPKSSVKKELNIEGKKIILNVARLIPQKNQDLLIDVYNSLREKFNDYVLVILGEGSQKEKLIKKVNGLGLTKNVFILGARSDVYDFYAESDFLSTSKIEGLSIAYLEAMAFGLPIIATETAGTREIIFDSKNGVVVPHCFQDILDAAINFIKEHGNLAHSNNFPEKFDIKNTILLYENLIVKAMGRY